MSKSSDKNGAGPLDGRRNNVPPEAGKIKPGEVRNKWGRGGKPQPPTLTALDKIFLAEAARIVSHGPDGPVDAKQRLVQEEFAAALRDRDSNVRARLLARLHDINIRVESRHEEILTFFIEAKPFVSEQFYFAEKMRLPAPDIVPHPNHVVVTDHSVEFYGPADRRERELWEILKASIRIAACLHDIIRAEYRRTGSSAVLGNLKWIEKHRRQLMRAVPKGWNWREEIYCRDSLLSFANEVVKDSREIGYAPFEACD